jgi:hypothetical protein
VCLDAYRCLLFSSSSFFSATGAGYVQDNP